MVFTSNEKMRCVFNSVVIKNEALNRKYKGGLRAFIEKHGDYANNDITVFNSMGDEVDDVVKDLFYNGLIHKEDFVFVDAGGFSMYVALNKKDYPQNYDIGVDWLKGRYADGGIWVWYVEGR